MKKITTIALTAAVALLLSAGIAAAGTTTGKVSQVLVKTSGSVYFHLEGTPALCSGASSGAHMGYVLPGGADGETRRMILSALLSAKLSGADVKVTTKDGIGGYGCELTQVYVE